MFEPISRFKEAKNWTTWQPAKFTSSDGSNFFLSCTVFEQNVHFWVYYLGCPQSSKIYNVTLTASGKGITKYSFTGNVNCLDEYFKEIVKEQKNTLMIGTNAAFRMADDGDNMASIEVNIIIDKSKIEIDKSRMISRDSPKSPGKNVTISEYVSKI